MSNSVGCKRPITMYLSSEYNFLYNKNIKEEMEEDKMSKKIVSLVDVGYSSKKEGKSNAIILKLRKGKMEWVLYDSLDKEQLKLILELVIHYVDIILMKISRKTLSRFLEQFFIYFECDKDSCYLNE